MNIYPQKRRSIPILYQKENFPHSEQLSKYGIYLPSSINLSINRIKYISSIVNKLTTGDKIKKI